MIDKEKLQLAYQNNDTEQLGAAILKIPAMVLADSKYYNSPYADDIILDISLLLWERLAIYDSSKGKLFSYWYSNAQGELKHIAPKYDRYISLDPHDTKNQLLFKEY